MDESPVLLDGLHGNSAVISIIAFCQKDSAFFDVFRHQTATLEAVVALVLQFLVLVLAEDLYINIINIIIL
jgi:hypothetical protein